MTYIPAALRQLIYEQADGRCEYCLISDNATFAAHEIDHVIAEKHGGLTEANKLALSCSLCNKQKGSDLKETRCCGLSSRKNNRPHQGRRMHKEGVVKHCWVLGLLIIL